MYEKLHEIVELYKNKKVSKLVLEKEIMLAMACNIDVEAIVTAPIMASTNITYGVAMLPDKRNGRFSLKVLIDNRIFENRMLSSGAIARMILENFKNREQILSEFNKLLKKDIVFIDYTTIYTTLLRIYRISLMINRATCAEFPEVLRILPTVEKLDQDINMLENGEMSLEQKKEQLRVDGFLCQDFIDFANRVEEIRNKNVITVDLSNADAPIENAEYDNIKSYCNPPYDDNYKVTQIPYDYIPRH